MSTRPRVHELELAQSINGVVTRRREVDDRHRELLPEGEGADPREVLDYLRRYSGPDIPLWVLKADVSDALTLTNWLWWEDRQRELHFLKAGVARGLFLAQIGSQVGIGKQGVRDRIDRLEAMLHKGGRPDEKIMRRQRRRERQVEAGTSPESAWLGEHRDEIVAVMLDLVIEADRYGLADDERDWLDELPADADEGRFTRGTMVMIGLAATELRTSRPVLALPGERPHRVHEVLLRADALRSAFAEI
jgi:hypothetical protein